MAYVDAEFYNTTYGGEPIQDAEQFDNLAKRASLQVDILTQFEIAAVGLDTWPPIIADRVRMATAAQVEFLAAVGATETNFPTPPPQAVAIGKFNITPGAAGHGLNGSKYASGMIEHLMSSGLLYAGVGVNA